MRFGLEEHVLEAIIQCIKDEPKLDKAILFGSRARGTQRYNSDIDIAIQSAGEIPIDLILKIEDAAGIYKVDIVDLTNIHNEDLRKSIEKDGVSLLDLLP